MALTIDINTWRAVFNATYEGSISGLWYPEVAGTPFDIANNISVYPGLDATAGLATYTGTRQRQNPGYFKISITNDELEDSIEVPLADFTADNLGLYNNAVAEMAQKAQFHWNKLTSTLLANGHSQACQDGQYFFDTDHSVSGNDSYTQRNIVTASQIPSLNVSDPDNPTATEMSTIIMNATAYLHTLKDAVGDAVNAGMRRVAIITGDFAKFAAIQSAISQVNLTGAVTNPVVTGLMSYGYQFVPVLEPALTGTSIYFVRCDSPVKPFILQQNGGIQIQTLGTDSEYAKANLKVLFGIYALRNGGYGRWQSALKATLS